MSEAFQQLFEHERRLTMITCDLTDVNFKTVDIPLVTLTPPASPPTSQENLGLEDVDLEDINRVSTCCTDCIILPRADGGRDAWLFLAACFVFEALVWGNFSLSLYRQIVSNARTGFPFSFGIFQSYYTTHAPFAGNHNGIAAIGTCSSGVMYLFAPVSLHILEAWPGVRRLSSIVGLFIAATALILSSFSTQIWHLIITQGVMYAIGGSLLYSPTMFYLDEWFEKKKGLAFGVMWSGVGASGLVFPFVLKALLDVWGFAYTLRVWAVILVFLCAPLIYFIKPRIPFTADTPIKKPSYVFRFKPTYLLLQASNILESFGFFIPAIYLPTYAASMHLSPQIGVLLLALLNLFSVIGAIALGFFCDKMHVSHVIAISTFGSTFSVLCFWGTADEVTRLIVFAMCYGAFAGGYSALWAGMMKEVQRVKGCEDVGMGVLMGVFAAGRGIGAVSSGPLSEVLLNIPIGGVAGFKSGYGALIVFTGASAFAGGIGWAVTRKMRGRVEGDANDAASMTGGCCSH
ncbi:hypothetical protein VTL71DRAFT_14271 [Oculimacula yallundae]|uniref:Uncharacterized protein n=1 Tax=Oculimacula yallundae TaxID=86028 RepID=A0ABR4CI04_9HELO